MHPLTIFLAIAARLSVNPADAQRIDLTNAVIVVRSRSAAGLVEHTAATVLAEETAKRAGVKWQIQESWPKKGWVIAITAKPRGAIAGRTVNPNSLSHKPESFTISTDRKDPEHPILWIAGADARGALFGVGKLLRQMTLSQGHASLPSDVNLTSGPAYPIRGHQLGYRATANSYDAWNPEQFDQYIRELALFGSNSVEGIPLHDTRATVNKYPRAKMNVDISRICAKYGQDYWMWIPADFDLTKKDLRDKWLKDQDDLFRACPSVAAIFVPGGDPGDNPARLVIPYIADLSTILRRSHPSAKVWLSMQGYSAADQDYVYRWIEREKPTWFGGLVAGPSSPPLQEMRARLSSKYPIRDYPDITHSVRCQFSVPWWDFAYAVTLGRECVNPRPHFFGRVIHDTMPFTQGFISYSDGIHDDFNKVLWSALAWNPDEDLHSIAAEYARVFFGDAAIESSDGILALEKNWEGPLNSNGGVLATYRLWSRLESDNPSLKSNWRWQLYLLRANYDLYTRQRLAFESSIEIRVNSIIASATNAGNSIDEALVILKEVDQHSVRKDLLDRIEVLCEDLWKSIGLQTSVKKYHASGLERGAVLDLVNYPLNNRWWLEDEFAKVKALPTEPERLARLKSIAEWEHPGPGSFYDAIGQIAKSPHEVRNEKMVSPLLDMDNSNTASFMMWSGNNPLGRARQTWMSYEQWPTALKYAALDPEADYVVRTTGFGDCLLRVNGTRVSPTVDGRKVGEIKEFHIPRGLYRDGTITLTFDPTFEPTINWRQQSRLSEVWLLKMH